MATRDDEIKDLKEKNNELVQKVQYWKMTAGQRENEKLALMKEINELRLKLSRLRSTGGVQARNFEAAIQATSEKALAHLVRASGEIAHTIELSKSYMRDRQELDASSPRWSAISGTPSTEKTERVHRVPPMMIGGQSIQPVVALSRTLFNTNSARPASRTPNQNRNLTERAMPMHMLQDVYIPLTRVDAGDRLLNNSGADSDAQDADNSAEDLGLEDSGERMDDSQEASGSEDFEASRRLDAVAEDIEPEDEVQTPPRKIDNPLEGPSWLLDTPEAARSIRGKHRVNLEPDSTTEVEECTSPHTQPLEAQAGVSACPRTEFTPTVRRRKRVCSPLSPRSPRSPWNPPARRISNSGRELKVMVAKMRLSSAESESSGASPPKRSALGSPNHVFARFDAPSPNGATDAALLVSEANTPELPLDNSTEQIKHRRDSRLNRIERNSTERRRNDHSDHERPRPHDQERPSRPHDQERPVKPHDNDRRRRGDHGRPSRPQDHEQGPHGDHERTRPHATDHERSISNPGDHEHRPTSMERSRAGSETSLVSSDGRDSDGDPTRDGRTRRPRKPVTYKEKPLNRKLRR